MWFRRCSIAGVTYLEDKGLLLQLLEDGDERNSTFVDTFTVSRFVFPAMMMIMSMG
jgi:hypothetical protein